VKIAFHNLSGKFRSIEILFFITINYFSFNRLFNHSLKAAKLNKLRQKLPVPPLRSKVETEFAPLHWPRVRVYSNFAFFRCLRTHCAGSICRHAAAAAKFVIDAMAHKTMSSAMGAAAYNACRVRTFDASYRIHQAKCQRPVAGPAGVHQLLFSGARAFVLANGQIFLHLMCVRENKTNVRTCRFMFFFWKNVRGPLFLILIFSSEYAL